MRHVLFFLYFLVAGVAQVVGGQSSADLGISKSGPENMIVGYSDPFTYQISACQNSGPNDSEFVIITDQVPPLFVVSSVIPSLYPGENVSCLPTINNLVNCTVTLLKVGDAARIKVNVTLPSYTLSFLANNTACVSAATFDPDSSNQCNSRVNNVVTSADLSVSVQGPSSGIAGQQESWSQTFA